MQRNPSPRRRRTALASVAPTGSAGSEVRDWVASRLVWEQMLTGLNAQRPLRNNSPKISSGVATTAADELEVPAA